MLPQTSLQNLMREEKSNTGGPTMGEGEGMEEEMEGDQYTSHLM